MLSYYLKWVFTESIEVWPIRIDHDDSELPLLLKIEELQPLVKDIDY